MCGIAGIIQYRRREEASATDLHGMLNTMIHRGPDDSGVLSRRFACFGMRRLSIIDVAGGHQPICNEDGRVWVILNGEIYNYRTLREKLICLGHVFQTNSDTEVVVHLYEEYGTECVTFLDGMFAFAIWDERVPNEELLFVARDPVGKKPLYYADTGSALIFGSELKSITSCPGILRELNVFALHDFLSLGQVQGAQSIFNGIDRLRPGHSLRLSMGGGAAIERYWSWPKSRPSSPEARLDIKKTAEHLLYAAVQKRLEAEVPLGVFLSGGLDSGVVAAIAARCRPGNLETFSVGFEGPAPLNELPLARVTAQHLNTHHHEFLFKPDIVELVPEILDATDEPFAISSAIPLFMLARAAKRQVTVVLTGDGGDEVFGGYLHYLYENWAQMIRTLPMGTSRIICNAAGVFPGSMLTTTGRLRKRIQQLARNAWMPPAERRLGWTSWFSEEEKWQLYSESTRKEMLARHVTPTANRLGVECEGNLSGAAELANQMDVETWLPDEMLVKVDRMTMSASVEARCPMLDRALIEYCGRLSMRQRIAGNTELGLKTILRQIATGLLPGEVVQQKKRGFNVPLDSWFRGNAQKYLEHYLSSDRVRRRGVFDPEIVGQIMHAHRSGVANLSNRLFGLLTFEIWAEKSM